MSTTTNLSSDSWSALLAALAPDEARQGEVYERLRTRLGAFFRFRGAKDPDALVDVVFDRVAAKIAQGEALDLTAPIPYFLGVARFVWLEAQRAAAKDRTVENAPVDPEPEDPRAKEARLAALEQCLSGLPGQQRRLIERYHEGRGRARNRARASLADDLGITVNALRIRAHRIRDALEKCVRRRLDDDTKREEPS